MHEEIVAEIRFTMKQPVADWYGQLRTGPRFGLGLSRTLAKQPRTSMQKVTEKFRLRSASTSTHEAVMLQKQIHTSTSEDERRQYVSGAKEYRLADGRHLTCIDEYTFEVTATGERLTRA
jgi:hypothetical protein